jgi:hypothetical protein
LPLAAAACINDLHVGNRDRQLAGSSGFRFRDD